MPSALTFLPTEMGFIQRWLGLTSLTLEQWLICGLVALVLLLVDEVIKFFMRRNRRKAEACGDGSADAVL